MKKIRFSDLCQVKNPTDPGIFQAGAGLSRVFIPEIFNLMH
jgi:hypothetical protein